MISPVEHTRVKEECRSKGVEVFSIFTYETNNTRQGSSVKDIILVSSLPYPKVMEVAIEYFNAIGYQGKVKLERSKEGCYRAILSKRLKY